MAQQTENYMKNLSQKEIKYVANSSHMTMQIPEVLEDGYFFFRQLLFSIGKPALGLLLGPSRKQTAKYGMEYPVTITMGYKNGYHKNWVLPDPRNC